MVSLAFKLWARVMWPIPGSVFDARWGHSSRLPARMALRLRGTAQLSLMR